MFAALFTHCRFLLYHLTHTHTVDTHTHTRSAPVEGAWDSRTTVPAGELSLFKNKLSVGDVMGGEEAGKGQPECGPAFAKETYCSNYIQGKSHRDSCGFV